MATYAVVRVRGHAKITRSSVETMEMMRLHRVNHCVLLKDDASTKGMLQAAKDYVTWGEVSHELIARMLFHRGEVSGGKRLTDSFVKENSGFSSILDLAKAIEKGDAKLADVKGLKPVLRLPPPKSGYRGVKRPFADGGALGYRGKDIEKLVDRMLPKPKGAK